MIKKKFQGCRTKEWAGPLELGLFKNLCTRLQKSSLFMYYYEGAKKLLGLPYSKSVPSAGPDLMDHSTSQMFFTEVQKNLKFRISRKN